MVYDVNTFNTTVVFARRSSPVHFRIYARLGVRVRVKVRIRVRVWVRVVFREFPDIKDIKKSGRGASVDLK